MCADIVEDTTYDGEEKRRLISPRIMNVEFEGHAGEKGRLHLDMDFGFPVTTKTLKALPKLINAIQNIQIEE